MRIFKYFIVIFLLTTSLSFAGVNLPFTCTFNCPEWQQGDSESCNCCDFFEHGDGYPGEGYQGHITADANRDAGIAGTKGYRHWLGDGSNVNSGGIKLTLNNYENEIWMRWYFRFQTGFDWWNPEPWSAHPTVPRGDYNQFKMMYWDIGNYYSIVGWPVTNTNSPYYPKSRIVQRSNNKYRYCWGPNWNTVMSAGGNSSHEMCSAFNGSTGECTQWAGTYDKVSDGAWHYMEVHIKKDTDGSDGICEWWVDDSADSANYCGQSGGSPCGAMDWGTPLGFKKLVVGSNKTVTDNGQVMYVDYDDIAISKTGKIGPYGSPPPPDETDPNVSITSPNEDEVINCTSHPRSMWLYYTATDNASGIESCRGSFSVQTFNEMGADKEIPLDQVELTYLGCGTAYTYSIACIDGSGNDSDPVTRTFSIGDQQVVEDRVWDVVKVSEGYGTGTTATASVTLQYGSGNNRLLVAVPMSEHSDTWPAMTSVVFDPGGGDEYTMTEVHQIGTDKDPSYTAGLGYYFALDANLPAAGAYNVTATQSSDAEGNLKLFVIEMINVEQATPAAGEKDEDQSTADGIQTATSEVTCPGVDGNPFILGAFIEGYKSGNDLNPVSPAYQLAEDLDMDGAIGGVYIKEVESGAQTLSVTTESVNSNRRAWISATWGGDTSGGDPGPTQGEGGNPSVGGGGVSGGGG